GHRRVHFSVASQLINPLTLAPKMSDHLAMKTTLEIPDSIFRRAKSKAAKQGISLRQFVTDALRDKLKSASIAPRQWVKPAAKAVSAGATLRPMNRKMDALIAEVFGSIEPQVGIPGKPVQS